MKQQNNSVRPSYGSTLVLGLRLLLRDWRTGELRSLGFSLLIAVTAVTAISLLGDRLSRTMLRQSAELLGGDLVVYGTRRPDPAWLESARELGMESAVTLEFASGVLFDDDLLLCGVKAVSDTYPLRGELRVADAPEAKDRSVRASPPPGKVWVDIHVLDRLGARIGDEIMVGAAALRIDKILTYEPDAAAKFYNMAPRLLMNSADLAATEILAPGTPIMYRYLFAGESASRLKAVLEPQMGAGFKLKDIHTRESRAGSALENAVRFLMLTAILAIFLASVAIAMAIRRYSERHLDVSAMLRCLGASQRQILFLYLWQFLLLTTITSVLGCLLGWLAHLLLLISVGDLLPPALPEAGPATFTTGIFTALLMMIGFALPPVMRLRKVPPLRVFRREITAAPVSTWLTCCSALFSMGILLLMLFENIADILGILLITSLVIFLIGGCLMLLLRWLRKRRPWQKTRLGRSLHHLASHGATSVGQILAFATTLMIMAFVFQLRSDLLERWQLQMPKNAPNSFAINIQARDKERFEKFLQKNLIANKTVPILYPIVRGRLVAIRDAPLSSEVNDTPGVRRELNLTWTDLLPTDNKIIKGQWVTKDNQGGISIEEQFAEQLEVELGDKLTFDIGGLQRSARISSVRSVVWESLSPNFFLIFAPGLLDNLPVTYLTSFRAPPEKHGILREIVRRFPSVTLLEVDEFIKRLQVILDNVTLVVELMMLFVLLAGLAVLFAAIEASRDERMQESALMRAVGASRQYLRGINMSEFALLGAISGILAALGCEIASYFFYSRVFDLPYHGDVTVWLGLPLFSGLVIGLAGYAGTLKVVRVSPKLLLK